MNKRLSIIVYSCWRNADMWSIFSELFKKYWNECSYEVILATDKNQYEENNLCFDKIICYDGSWYEMISNAIKIANTEYVILMMDDYLLNNYIDEKKIEQCINDAEKYKAANIRFVKTDIRLEKEIFKEDGIYDLYMPGKAYSLSTHIGIWNSELLLNYMRPEWSAWDFERIGSLTICDTGHPLLGTNDFEFPYVEGVRKGRWMKAGIEVCEHNGISIDFSKRKKYGVLGEALLRLKTIIYNINPTLMLRIYNCISDTFAN